MHLLNCLHYLYWTHVVLRKVFKTPSKPEWCELGVSEKIAE
jgi:hypothetical protein